MDNKGIKVLMMGGERVGKSSMPAGLFSTLLGSEVKQLVSVKDITAVAHIPLQDKIDKLQSVLKEKEGKVILLNEGKTNDFIKYQIELTIPSTSHRISMTFTDANGEYYSNNARHADRWEVLRSEVKNSDIIMIAIDTVFLMGKSESENEQANCLGDVHALLSNLELEDTCKLVVFVPLKCEKWAMEGRIDEVTKKVELCYSTPINHLSKSPLVELVIMPVQTVGSVVYYETLPAYNYCVNGKVEKCSVYANDTMIRFANGNERFITPNDYQSIVEDSESVFIGSSIERPNVWFKVISSNYNPKNCEQLAYHILRYMLNRAIDAEYLKKQENKKKSFGIWKWALAVAAIASGVGVLYGIAAAAFLFDNKLGDTSVDELEKLIQKIKSKGLIKDSGDGIRIIKRYERISK